MSKERWVLHSVCRAMPTLVVRLGKVIGARTTSPADRAAALAAMDALFEAHRTLYAYLEQEDK